MGEFQIGKEMGELQHELQITQKLVEQLYGVVEHNLKIKKLVEPKEETKGE